MQDKEKILDFIKKNSYSVTFHEMTSKLSIDAKDLADVIAVLSRDRIISVRIDHCNAEFAVQEPRSKILYERFLDLLFNVRPVKRSVRYYAEQLCVTPKYLSKIVMSYSHRTPSNWIREKMVDEIEHRLRYSDDSIKEIAFLLDFPSLSFMGKYFKSVKGMSPKTFRKTMPSSVAL